MFNSREERKEYYRSINDGSRLREEGAKGRAISKRKKIHTCLSCKQGISKGNSLWHPKGHGRYCIKHVQE